MVPLSIKEHLTRINNSDLGNSQKQIFAQAIATASLPDKATALSVSVGDGVWDYLALQANKKIGRITATDVIDHPVKKRDVALLNKFCHWNFVKVKEERQLPFPDNSFDLIFHQDVIEHVRKPHLFLAEQYRVLRKNGTIVFGTPNLFRVSNLLKLIIGKLHFPIKIGYHRPIGDYIHIQEFYEQQLRVLLQEVGFNNVQVHHSLFGIYFLNLTFSLFPQSKPGQSLSHFLTITAQK